VRPLRQALAAAALAVGAVGAGAQTAAPPKARDAAEPEAVIDVPVQPGDTLIGLSTTLFNTPTDWREVARLNRLPNANRVSPGQVLRVPARLLRSQAVPATLTSVEGEVLIDKAPATAGSSVREGQSIQTGERSSAVVELPDGSRVKLPPSSLVEVMNSRRYGGRPAALGTAASASAVGAAASAGAGGAAPESPTSNGLFSGALRLLRGSIEIFATQVLRAKPLELTTPTAVIGVRGTQYRAGIDADGDVAVSRVEVLEGRVQVDVVQKPVGVSLPAGFATRVQAAADAPVATALLPAPDLAAVPARFERPLVRFAVPGAAETLRVQVAADAAFDRVLRDDRVPPGTDVRIADLPDGRWFLRARRQDAQGLEGYDATRSFVLKARPEPPPVNQPPPRAKKTVGSIDFNWAASAQTLTYRLQVARDAAFADVVVDRSDLGENTLKLDLPEAGPYHWRIASIATGNDQGPYGDAQSFELRDLPTPPQGGVSADGAVQFRWGGRPEDRQQVELARDLGFTDIVARAELNEPVWTPPKPGASGVYYFRYRSVEPDGYVSPYSSPLKIEVPFDKRWLLLGVPLLLLGL